MKDILLIIGSESDKKGVAPGVDLMQEKGMSFDLVVYSAHRNLEELMAYLKTAQTEYRVIITAAGLSAALPGVVSSQVKNPVIGVPLVAGELAGIDALLAIAQLPRGVPVATMGSGKEGIMNAVLLAERIIAVAQALTAITKFTWPIPDKGLRKRLPRIAAATLALFGEQDNFISPRYAEDFARGLGRAQMSIVKNAGHMLPYEKTDEVVGLIERFLAAPA